MRMRLFEELRKVRLYQLKYLIFGPSTGRRSINVATSWGYKQLSWHKPIGFQHRYRLRNSLF